MRSTERLLAIISVLLVFVYVVLRSIYVATCHDEAATFFHYIVPGKFVPYHAHWDANNHFLNSALSWVCYKLLGPAQWSIRLPNVLSFLIYGYFSIRISEQIKNSLIRWMVFLALLTATFLLEFFAMARGYAMSIAFFMAAVFYAGQYLRFQKLKYQFYLWFWMWLAVAASLTLINSYLIMLGVVVLGLIQVKQNRWKHFLALLFLGVPVLLAAVVYAFDLKEKGLLYTGLADGFIEVTVRSLVRYQLDRESAPISNLVTLIGGISAVFLVFHYLTRSLKWNAVLLASVLLLLNALASISLNLLFGMNFPENRVGMYYIPLFLITVAGALDVWSSSNRKLQWLALTFLVFPAHLVKHFNFNTSILWPRWHASEGIYNRAVQQQREIGETQMLSAEYLNELGWAYYNFQNDAEMQLLQRDPVPDTLADMIIGRPEDFDFATVPYDTIYHDAPNNVYLLRRTVPINWSEPKDAPIRQYQFSGSNEFYELVNDSVSKLPGRVGMWELEGVFTSDGGLSDGQLIITSQGPNSEDGTYNMIPLHWIRSKWNRDTIHVKRTYYFSPNATNFKVYFWNIHQDSIAFNLMKLKFRVPE
ncbi:MAG: hypothetical protein H6601_03045 [Flavobacteriales bacterium]|nr:hypothetical protein [Flavobacteriales bacterium]MCB9185704.1 hypothetical protein [Flavobacteriales bacterium]